MKFSVIEMGQRFKYKGEPYTKNSPLVANNEESGKQKLFRRADNVEPLFDMGTKTKGVTSDNSNALIVSKLMQSFDVFYVSCVAALDEHLCKDLANEKQALFAAMEQAKDEFVNKCKQI